MNQQHVQTSKANKTKGKTTWGLDAIVVVGEASDTARRWESAAPQAYCAWSVAIVGTKAEVVKHREAGQGGGALRIKRCHRLWWRRWMEGGGQGGGSRSEWVELYGTASCGVGGGRPHRSHIRWAEKELALPTIGKKGTLHDRKIKGWNEKKRRKKPTGEGTWGAGIAAKGRRGRSRLGWVAWVLNIIQVNIWTSMIKVEADVFYISRY